MLLILSLFLIQFHVAVEASFRQYFPGGLSGDGILSRSREMDIMAASNFFHEVAGDVASEDWALKCMAHFDLDKDGALKGLEVGRLCQQLFVDEGGRPYDVPGEMSAELFRAFDADWNGKIDAREMRHLWSSFVVPCIRPNAALVAVDVQNDFINGSLAVCDGAGVVPAINDLLGTDLFRHVFFTQEWHPDDHISFIDNVHLYPFDRSSPITAEDARVYDTVVFKGPPRTEQILWPKHCVQQSVGAALHPDLHVPPTAPFIRKTTSSTVDGYSAFFDNLRISATGLEEQLRSRQVTDVFVVGLVYEFCVGSTALDSLDLGFKTWLVRDATRGMTREGLQVMRDRILRRGVVEIDSCEVSDIVRGRDRRPQLGMSLLAGINKAKVDGVPLY